MRDKTFRETSRDFLAHHAIYSADPSTMAYQFRVLNRTFGPMLLAEIGTRQIEAFIAARLKEGISKATINRQRAALSVFFNWTIRAGLSLPPNPIAAVRKFRENVGRTRYMTPAEVDRLLIAAAPHLKPIIAVAVHTGGRLSEVLALRWEDCDLEAGVITYRRENTKSSRTRIVPLSPALHGILSALRKGKPHELLFLYNERPIRSVRTAFAQACKKAGLEGVTMHVCRHTFASLATMAGLDPRRLQKYLGHSSLALTERYSHLSPEYLRDGARFLGPRPAVSRTDADHEKGG